MGKKGAKIDLESTQKSIEVGLAAVWGTCCQQEAGTLLVSTSGTLAKSPLFWAPLVSGKGVECWFFSWRAVVFFSHRLRMQSSNTCLSLWQQLPYFLETNNLRVGKCFRFWIQPTNWHINSLQSSLSQMSMIIKITRHLFSAHSLMFLTLWTRASRESSEKLCV